MTDYSELVGNPIVASVIQSDEVAFEEAVAKAVRSSDNLNLAAAKVALYVSDVLWDVLYGLEDYEPIAYSLAYEGKKSLDYEGCDGDLYNVVKAYATEHVSRFQGSRNLTPRKTPTGKPKSKQKTKAQSSQCLKKKPTTTKSKAKTKPKQGSSQRKPVQRRRRR